MSVLPFAKYGTKQDKQGQYHHFQLPSSKLYLPLLCLKEEGPVVKES